MTCFSSRQIRHSRLEMMFGYREHQQKTNVTFLTEDRYIVLHDCERESHIPKSSNGPFSLSSANNGWTPNIEDVVFKLKETFDILKAKPYQLLARPRRSPSLSPPRQALNIYLM
ncbi:hypothetical protein DPMN_066263 [Dreissena polymorpha]|uniref:Uncharacterized protein n=1 Tax=Dreissena polymorpha TaxID=45954 RepID=A0A9D3YY25_DREPO|nr:hypothetical protein DPMN_066263 [Dreissena polymorpha]